MLKPGSLSKPQALLGIATTLAPILGPLLGRYTSTGVREIGGRTSLAELPMARKTAKKSFKRKPYKAPKRSFKKYAGKRKRAKLSRTVRKLQRTVNGNMATHSHRILNNYQYDTFQGSANFWSVPSTGSRSAIEVAATKLRYFDPGTNAMVTASAATGTYTRSVRVWLQDRIEICNNYRTACHVELYSCIPKVDTNDTPTVAYSQSMVDQGNPDAESVLVNFGDAKELKKMWTLKRVQSKWLNGGQTMVAFRRSKSFDYDFAVADEQTQEYQRRYGGHIWLIRVYGAIAHDNVSGVTQACHYMEASVDVITQQHFNFFYDAGKNVREISIDESQMPASLTGATHSQRPRADNQVYSV